MFGSLVGGLAALASMQTSALPIAANTQDIFRQEVGTACVEAAKGSIGEGQASVDPTGSTSFGLAVVRSTIDPKIAVICVYDKRTRTVELGSHMKSR